MSAERHSDRQRRFVDLTFRLNPFAAILRSSKSFSEPWIGSHRLNRWGLHLLRMQLADAMFRLRSSQQSVANRWPRLSTLRSDGVLVMPDFLPQVAYRSLREELRTLVNNSLQTHPPHGASGPGFGRRHAFAGGFDRYDGDTLNRFLDINAGNATEAFRVVRDERLLALCSAAQTRPAGPDNFSIYYTRNGDGQYPDIQQDLHRDTFHHAIKCWLYLEDVPEDAGPFVYVPGSHRMTPGRKGWERANSIAASDPAHPQNSSSFRVSNKELQEMGYSSARSYPVAGNTLIIADTLGFHARGSAAPGTERLALYGSFRPWPFNPWAR